MPLPTAARADQRQATARRRRRLRAASNILLIGSTGFVGKVCAVDAAASLSRRRPGVLPRAARAPATPPTSGSTRRSRRREVFDPLRDVHGDSSRTFLRSKIVAVPGDIGRPLCNFSDEQFADFERAGGLHVIINSAGLVSFAPSLESALRINAMGAKNVLDAARRASARLVPRVDLLRRRSARRRRLGGRAGRRLLPAQPGDLARLGARVWPRAPRSRLRSDGRDRGLSEDHRSGARAIERSPAHLRVPRARRPDASRSAPRSRRRE